MSADGPQLAPAVRRVEERAESQVEFGQGLGRRNETRLVNSDEEKIWNTGPGVGGWRWPGGIASEAPLRSSQSRKQGGQLVLRPTWADRLKAIRLPRAVERCILSVGGWPGFGSCGALGEFLQLFLPLLNVGFPKPPFSWLPSLNHSAVSPLPQ